MSNLNLNFYENPLIQPLGESEASTTASNSNGANILIEQLYKFYGEVKVLETLGKCVERELRECGSNLRPVVDVRLGVEIATRANAHGT